MSKRTSANWTPALLISLVAAGLILSLSMGLRQSLGLFMEPMVRGGAVTAATFGFAMAMQNLAWGIGQPFMGAMCDRYGGRLVVSGAAILYCAGLAMMVSGGALGLYIGGGLLIGLAVAATSHGVLVGIISRLASPAIRATAVSILAAVGSLGTFVVAPATQAIIGRWNWQTALAGLALLAASMTAMAFLFRRNAPRATGAPASPNARRAIGQALSNRSFVITTLAFFACGFQLIFIATHLPNFIAICGLPPSVGANALALIGICNAFGTLLAGYLCQRWGNGPVLAMIYLLRTLSIALFFALPVTVETTLIFAAAMGFLWLSVVPPISGIINSLFGPANFGTLFGVMFLSHQIGAFLGAWLGGLSYQISGTYSMGWLALVAVGAMAVVLQLGASMERTLRLPSS
ncbi:MFS transporter (plasmid) [Agrobacterium salinitolerans]|uniref:MFS transporter n=1 Tax=Agrobacterium salinitolerans TaxID=1183413 RepID=UPI001C21A8B4|nr:MFS transporter [Agrobacterium salinitolerans]QXC52868.1 MFS transporter [Agrobacterium salinitolerans]